MNDADYPEHQKLQAVKDKSQAIGEFLDWLRGTKDFRIAKWEKVSEGTEYDDVDELVQLSVDVEKLLAEYFHIDLNKLEQEKLAILREIRKAQEEKQ